MLYIYYGLSEKKTNELVSKELAKVSGSYVFTFEDIEESEENGDFVKYNLFEFLEEVINGGQYEYLYKDDNDQNLRISMEECIDYIIEITEGDDDVINNLSINIYESEDQIVKIYHMIDDFTLEIVSQKFDEIKRQYEELFHRLSTHTNTWE